VVPGRHGVVSGLSVVVEGRERPFGVLGAHTSYQRSFGPDEVIFVQAVASMLSMAVERHRNDAANRHAALHDALTGLPNRTLVLDRIASALRRRAETAVAVLLFDLVGFKHVNDSLGHAAGDEMLRALAPRLLDGVRAGDTVARLGGDEFVVLCESLDGPRAAVQVAERLLRAVREPVRINGREQSVTASIGIALAARADDTPDSLVRDADAAMYRVKDRGRGGWELFHPELSEQLGGRAPRP
jgi:diguanylate cyclase (GGDEF)-like protein